MISNWMIYLIGIVDGITGVAIFVASASTIIVVVLAIIRHESKIEPFDSLTKRLISTAVICVFIFCITPNQKSLYLMIVNSTLTKETFEAGKEELRGAIDYLFEKIDGINKEQ
jgi:O-antigen/teichoic acid export membrane protein